MSIKIVGVKRYHAANTGDAGKAVIDPGDFLMGG